MSEFNEVNPRLKSPKNRFQSILKNVIQFLVDPTIFKPRLKFFKFGIWLKLFYFLDCELFNVNVIITEIYLFRLCKVFRESSRYQAEFNLYLSQQISNIFIKNTKSKYFSIHNTCVM